ncbi:facilitated trehalose transporter Tret1-like isoform X2 [Anoplophora glabripennis]|uniref:facilitated trehalose transporter Tret1-like isoform X2 n=1 Tax=Anoplophora glabripennis TaxID=217634 RepID=UPI0008741344|nr:facilitated trehalose transporter Tret1-like isoform X2 [Anoplophora glabripennis]
MVCMASLAAPIGCFLSGPIADKFGRRISILCINVTCFIGWLTIYSAYAAGSNQYLLLLLGRFLTGLSIGLSSAPAIIYMAEVSSSKYRGVFTTWGSIFFSLGILLVYMLGYFLKERWGTMALISCFFPCIGMTFVLFFIPETPSWLVGKNRLEEAKENMCMIFGTKEYHPVVQSEIEGLIQAKGVKKDTTKKSIPEQMLRKVKYLLKPYSLKPFGLVFTYFFFQQLSGTFVIIFYAIDIVRNAGVILDPYITIVMVALTRVVTAVLVGFLSKKFGRRPLSIVSGTGMMLCMFTLACYNLLIDQGRISESLRSNLTLLPLLAVMLYFFTSTLGFLPVPFALAAEYFPTKIRGTASGLLTGCGYIFNFLAVKIYPTMVDSMRSTGVFFFYGCTSLVGTVFLICLLPETRGKTQEEILEYFGNKTNKTDIEEQERNFKENVTVY